MVDQRRDLALDRVERRCFEQPRLADAAAEVLEAVALLAQVSNFVLGAIKLRVARVVAVEPAGVDLDRAWSATGSGALDGFARRLVHLEEIVAADLDAGKAETGG